MLIYSLSLLFTSLVSFASADCASVDLNQLSDDKISEYTHCFKDAEVTISETPKTTSKLKFTPVCDRSESVKLELENIFKNSCEQISKDMLFSYNGTFTLRYADYTEPKVGDFSGMSNLKRLFLNNSRISILPAGIFDDLENLTELVLSENKIEELPINIFGQLYKLNRLSLRDNNIETIPIGAFDSLVTINELYLAENKIEELPINIFDKLLNLEVLVLSHNDIKVLSKPIINTPKNSLVGLYLTGNPITHIYNSAFNNMSNLRGLGIGGTNLTIIGINVFEPLISLRLLYLSKIKSDKSLISEQANELTISLNEISLEQFTQQKPFPLLKVDISFSDILIRNQSFINQLEEKGVYIVH